MSKPIKVLQIQPIFYVRTSDLHEEIINALSDAKFDVTATYLSGSPGKGDMLSAYKKIKFFLITHEPKLL